MIKAVLYDLGDIFFEAHWWRKWNYEQLFNAGLYKKSFSDFYDFYETFLEPVYKGQKKYDEGFDDFLKQFFLENPDSFKRESLQKKKYFENTRSLFEGVYETLEILHNKGIANIVITDNEATESEIREQVLYKYGINKFLYKIITSKDTGVKKPDPLIFEKALSLINLTKTEVIFVAHDKDEIDGAKKNDLQVIEFNNYLQHPTLADYKIQSFPEIINIVQSL